MCDGVKPSTEVVFWIVFVDIPAGGEKGFLGQVFGFFPDLGFSQEKAVDFGMVFLKELFHGGQASVGRLDRQLLVRRGTGHLNSRPIDIAGKVLNGNDCLGGRHGKVG